MLKYISSTKLNLAVLAQIIGLVLIVKATLLNVASGIGLFVFGAIWYRRELKAVISGKSVPTTDSAA